MQKYCRILKTTENPNITIQTQIISNEPANQIIGGLCLMALPLLAKKDTAKNLMALHKGT